MVTEVMQVPNQQERSTHAIELSVLVPAYNAAVFLARNLARIAEYLRAQSYGGEIVVIDDGSTDATAEVAEAAAASIAAPPIVVVRAERNEGKGGAIIRGLRAARGEFAVIMDADLEYEPEQIGRALAALRSGADVAVANRQLPESRQVLHRAALPEQLLRYAFGRTLNLLVRAFLLPGLRDTQAGLKGLRLATCRPFTEQMRCRRFSADVELLMLARQHGARIVEFPVIVASAGHASTIRLANDGAAVLRDIGTIVLRAALGRVARAAGWQAGPRMALAPQTLGLAAGAAGAAMAILGALSMGVFHLSDKGGPAVTAWTVSLLGLFLGGVAADGGWYRSRRPRFASRGEAAAFFVLVLFAAGLRLYGLDALPPMMHGDSAECGNLGRAIMDGEVADVFDFSPWYNTPFISFTPYAASFAVAGISPFSLRLPSAVTGTAAVIPFYFLARALYGARVARFATLLMAASHPLVHFSRIGLWNIQVTLYQVAALAFLLAALRRRSAAFAALGGMVTGVGLFSYTGARIVPVIAAAVLLFALLRAGRKRLEVLRVALAYAVAVGVAAMPLALNYVKRPEVLEMDRAADVSIFAETNAPHLEAVYLTSSPWAVLRAQVRRTLAGFATAGDSSTQYGSSQPILSRLSLPFFVAGVLLCLWRVRESRSFLVLVWLGATLLFGSILVIDPPSHTRLVGVFPAVGLLVAIGLDALLRELSRRLPGVRRRHAAALAGFVLAQAVVFNLSGYRDFVRRADTMSREWDVLKVIAGGPPKVDYYLFTGPFLYASAPVFRLFAAGSRLVTSFTETDIPQRLRRDTFFVLTPEFQRFGLAIQERLPGTEREVYRAGEEPQVIVYRCTIKNACRRGTS